MSQTVIHGMAMSTCVQRAIVSAYEAGIDIKLEQCSDFGEIKTEAWLKNQPFGQMPYIEDDGEVVFESRAIAKYLLAKKGDSKLMPTASNPKAYAAFETACSIETANFDSFAAPLTYEKVFKSMFGAGPADEEKVKELSGKLAKKLEAYEVILSKTTYLAGNDLTLADLFHLPYGVHASRAGVAPGLTDGSLPHVTKWWKNLTELESWKKTVALSA